MTRYLTLPEVLDLAHRLDADEVRDTGLLESALARPESSAFGRDAYPDVWLKAAALMESHARNHALVDGNKRISWYTAWVFLHLNGHPLDPAFDVDEAERFVLDACQGKLAVAEIAEGLERFAR
ncbi:Fic family protein [Streptomyces sp. SID4985]|uniref:Fic family protein n=1 Tax=unclassified Streptomyces TaxID=2593676 RepID=UPI001371A82D|nr:death-on-curing protein [Streptomyces sp. SID4985]